MGAAQIALRGVPFRPQHPVPVVDKGVALGDSLKVDVLVASKVFKEWSILCGPQRPLRLCGEGDRTCC